MTGAGATAGREYGSDKAGVPNNSDQPVSGVSPCDGRMDAAAIIPHGSRQHRLVGTFQGVPVYAVESMEP